MECRYKPQSTYTHKKHHEALPNIQTGIITSVGHHYPLRLYPFRQLSGNHISWNQPGCQTRQKQRHGESCSCNQASIPKHQTFRISNHCQSTTTIGSQQYGTAIKHTLTTTRYNAMHNRKHHHSSREVIQICRNNKGNYC